MNRGVELELRAASIIHTSPFTAARPAAVAAVAQVAALLSC